MRATIFSAMWLLIGAASSVDLYFLVKFRNVIQTSEENPAGLLLVRLDGGDVSLFACLKMAGTIVALGALAVLYWWRPGWGLGVAASLTAFQAGLLLYMTS